MIIKIYILKIKKKKCWVKYKKYDKKILKKCMNY